MKPKYALRSCGEKTVHGKSCHGRSLAFVDRPVCSAHATLLEKDENDRCWTEWMTAARRGGLVYGDCTFDRYGDGRFSIAFHYNEEIIKKVKQIEGARWDQAHKVWHFPDESWNDILAISGHYFTRHVMNGGVQKLDDRNEAEMVRIREQINAGELVLKTEDL